MHRTDDYDEPCSTTWVTYGEDISLGSRHHCCQPAGHHGAHRCLCGHQVAPHDGQP